MKWFGAKVIYKLQDCNAYAGRLCKKPISEQKFLGKKVKIHPCMFQFA